MRLNFRLGWFRFELLPKLRIIFDPRKVLLGTRGFVDYPKDKSVPWWPKR